MKKRIGMLLTVCLLLAGCGRQTVQHPPEQVLTVLTPEETLWQPFLQEFEDRSGCWIRTEEMDAMQAAEFLEEEPADLLLGYDPEVLEVLVPGAEPRTVFRQTPVLIYNPTLIRKNPPKGYEDLTDPRWQGNFVLENPGHSTFGAGVLSLLVRQNPDAEPQQVLRKFSENLAGLTCSGGEVLELVRDGTYALGIVAQSQVLDVRGLSVVRPESGTVPLAMAMTGTHPQQTEALMTFLTEEGTQRHAAQFCGLEPAEGTDGQRSPIPLRELLELWRQIREDTP